MKWSILLKKFRFTPLLQPSIANFLGPWWIYFTILLLEQISCPHPLHARDEHFAPTNKSLRIASCSNFKGRGLLHNVTVYHGEVKMAHDFHVFFIQDFDVMIGHPLEKLFVESPRSGDLDVS